MIGYFLFGSKFDGLNIRPYRSVLPSRALTDDRFRRDPAGGLQARDVGARDLRRAPCRRWHRAAPSPAASVGGRIRIDDVLAVRRQLEACAARLPATAASARRHRGSTLYSVLVVRVAARLAADAGEPHRARRRIQAQHFGDVPVAARSPALQLAGGEVVQVQVAPVAALAPPQHFVALRQVAPVDRVDAALEPGLRAFRRTRRAPRRWRRRRRAARSSLVVARGRGEGRASCRPSPTARLPSRRSS